ncbi:MAG: hypothetical protein GY822_28875, partial [Deltaproteobacteria bacterium]|nr:hypothetical protein [Deltaproteobacteria bacterium]
TITKSATSVAIGDTATFTFTLSDSTTDFAVTDITATGGTIGSFNGSGAVYTAVFTPDADFSGTATVAVGAGAFADDAGNESAAASDNALSVDTVAPEVTVSSNVTNVFIGDSATISFTLSKAPTDFVLNDVVVTGGTIASFAVDGTNPLLYTATFTPDPDFVGAATISVPAAAFTDNVGNDNTEGDVSLAVNTNAPTVAITSSATTLASEDTAVITVTLSSPSTTFADGDITAKDAGGSTVGTISGFTAVSSTVYTAVYTPATSSSTPAIISVAASAFTDLDGNNNLAGSLQLQIDTAAPTVTITKSATSVAIGDTATFTFTLSDSTTDFAVTDITATGGTIGSFNGSG